VRDFRINRFAPLADDVALAQRQLKLCGGADRHGESAIGRDDAALAHLQRLLDDGEGELVRHFLLASTAPFEPDLAIDESLFKRAA
jgi:hypothetical protein